MDEILIVAAAQLLSPLRLALALTAAGLFFLVRPRVGVIAASAVTAVFAAGIAFTVPPITEYFDVAATQSSGIDPSFDLEARLKADGLWRERKWDYVGVGNPQSYDALKTYYERRDHACNVLLSSSGQTKTLGTDPSSYRRCQDLRVASGLVSSGFSIAIFIGLWSIFKRYTRKNIPM